jgi:hypothetical protein
VPSFLVNLGSLLSAPWNSRDMIQGHFVTRFRIHSVLTNNPTLTFYRSLGPRFVSGHLRPTLLTLSPYSPYASSILHPILASCITWHFFAACVGCWLQVSLLLVHRFLSPWSRRLYVPPKLRFSQEPHGVTSQKTPFFIVTAVKTSNLTGNLLGV